MNEFKIEVVRRPGYDLYEIYLFKRHPGGVENATIKDGEIKFSFVKEDSNKAKPLMTISGLFWADFVRAVAEDLPNISKKEVDAELKATKYHLEDMRKIVFKEDK